MLRCLKFFACGLIVITFVGCANIEVYSTREGASNTSGRLNGIPFYIKVPVLTQDTKLLKSDLMVQIDVTVDESGTKQITHYPNVEPLKLDYTQENLELATGLIRALVDTGKKEGWTFAKTETQITKVIDYLIASKAKTPSLPEVVNNVWAVSMVVGPKQYYITNRIPLFGSASSTFKFASDGTLTEATSAITDDTAKTLLGLFPISAKLSNQWGITKQATAGAPTANIQIEGKITSVKTLYSLRKITVLDESTNNDLNLNLASTPPKREPLSLSQALAGDGGVQLVSKEVQTDSAKPKGDSKAYQLQGTITPPDTGSSSSKGTPDNPAPDK
jgi:hypothetical protein